jgi:hypothetical protein
MAAFVKRNWVFAWLAVMTAAVVFVGLGQAESPRKVTNFDEINVHRINVVEPDGKPRVIISNRKSMAGIYWAGKEYRHATRDNGGFLFFNDDGTEVGGMIFSNRKQGEHYSASSSLLFDHYNQQEALGLVYGEEDGKREAGLRVWDQPKESLFPLVEMNDKMARAATDEERAKIKKEMEAKVKTMTGPFFGERLFAGKQLGSSVLKLNDGKGRTRLVLKVSESGEPSVEFLDEAGKVRKRITPE